jgi:hypothetical protein
MAVFVASSIRIAKIALALPRKQPWDGKTLGYAVAQQVVLAATPTLKFPVLRTAGPNG